MKELINMEDEYQTKDNRSVRILCIDRRDDSFPVIGLVDSKDEEYIHHFSKEGEGIGFTLIKIPTKKEGWMNIYKSDRSYIHDTEEEANNKSLENRIKCVKVTWEE